MLNSIKWLNVQYINDINNIPYIRSNIKERKTTKATFVQSIFALDKDLKLVSPYIKVNKVMVPIEKYALDNKQTISDLLRSGIPIFYKYDSFVYLAIVDYRIKDRRMTNNSIDLMVPIDIEEDNSMLTVFSVKSQFEENIIKLLDRFCKSLILVRSNKTVKSKA
ncbi:hypothetical protein [Clostridioides difficile]|uniref:hypothetical protein n=1 Tax=Clostridioides difficile TaxID=1496 RepID=UPI001034A942|nr:hypothetical protein [Clostridioides difficile]MDM9943983.1 hypothetical protein [Clostridioides difficile]